MATVTGPTRLFARSDIEFFVEDRNLGRGAWRLQPGANRRTVPCMCRLILNMGNKPLAHNSGRRNISVLKGEGASPVSVGDGLTGDE